MSQRIEPWDRWITETAEDHTGFRIWHQAWISRPDLPCVWWRWCDVAQKPFSAHIGPNRSSVVWFLQIRVQLLYAYYSFNHRIPATSDVTEQEIPNNKAFLIKWSVSASLERWPFREREDRNTSRSSLDLNSPCTITQFTQHNFQSQMIHLMIHPEYYHQGFFCFFSQSKAGRTVFQWHGVL